MKWSELRAKSATCIKRWKRIVSIETRFVRYLFFNLIRYWASLLAILTCDVIAHSSYYDLSSLVPRRSLLPRSPREVWEGMGVLGVSLSVTSRLTVQVCPSRQPLGTRLWLVKARERKTLCLITNSIKEYRNNRMMLGTSISYSVSWIDNFDIGIHFQGKSLKLSWDWLLFFLQNCFSLQAVRAKHGRTTGIEPAVDVFGNWAVQCYFTSKKDAESPTSNSYLQVRLP